VKYTLQIEGFLNGQRLNLKEISPKCSRVTLRSVPLRGSYWAQPAADQKSSKGLPWYRCS